MLQFYDVNKTFDGHAFHFHINRLNKLLRRVADNLHFSTFQATFCSIDQFICHSRTNLLFLVYKCVVCLAAVLQVLLVRPSVRLSVCPSVDVRVLRTVSQSRKQTGIKTKLVQTFLTTAGMCQFLVQSRLIFGT